MRWVKPEFEVLELMSEATCYRYSRQAGSSLAGIKEAGASGFREPCVCLRRARSQLGSAAGGGLPQWNCHCRVCEAARDGGAVARTQSSVAVRGSRGPWFLLNASPDLRQQLSESLTTGNGLLQETPVGGVVLTDAEIDHAAGLLLLRESDVPLRVWSTAPVRAALSDGYPILRMLERYCGVQWSSVEPEQVSELAGSSLELEAFDTGGDPPLYVGDDPQGPGSIGLTIRDRDSGARLVYAPALATLDRPMLERLEASALRLWTDVLVGRRARRAGRGTTRRPLWAICRSRGPTGAWAGWQRFRPA